MMENCIFYFHKNISYNENNWTSNFIKTSDVILEI